MNDATTSALQARLDDLERLLGFERNNLAELDKRAGEIRQNIAYMEDFRRQIEEDTPKQFGKETRNVA